MLIRVVESNGYIELSEWGLSMVKLVSCNEYIVKLMHVFIKNVTDNLDRFIITFSRGL